MTLPPASLTSYRAVTSIPRMRPTGARANRLVVPEEGLSARDYIARQAIRLFSDRGFRGTSMNDVAEACGVTKPALYKYFENKSALLEYAYEAVSQNLWRLIDELGRPSASPEAQLRALITAQVSYHLENRRFLSVFWRERRELDDRTRATVRKHESRYEETVKGIFREGQAIGAFAPMDVEIAASSFLGLLSTVYRWGRHTGKRAGDIADAIGTFVLSGIRAK